MLHTHHCTLAIACFFQLPPQFAVWLSTPFFFLPFSLSHSHHNPAFPLHPLPGLLLQINVVHLPSPSCSSSPSHSLPAPPSSASPSLPSPFPTHSLLVSPPHRLEHRPGSRTGGGIVCILSAPHHHYHLLLLRLLWCVHCSLILQVVAVTHTEAM